MKQKLTRFVSLLCLVATLATCLVIVPVTVSAAAPSPNKFAYDKIVCGPETAYDVANPAVGDRFVFYGSGLWVINKAAYAPLAEGTYSLFELFGKEGAYADAQNSVTFYTTYFKQFETSEFANGLDNKAAAGYAAAFEAAITAFKALYPSAIAQVGSNSAALEWEYCNANPNYKTFKTYDFAKAGNGFWINFDYYYDPDIQALGDVGNFQFRFNKKGAIRFSEGSHSLVPYTTLEGDPVAFTEEGWNRVSLFFEQTTEVTSTTVEGVTTYAKGGESMTVTIYLNGVEKEIWNATASGMSGHPLYTSTVDPATGAITATPTSWGSYAMSLYCTAMRTTRIGYRLSRFGAASVSTGTKSDLTVKPLDYELDEGLALPTEVVEPGSEQYMPAKNYFFVPLATKSGVTAMTFLDYSAKNYYDTSKALALPTLSSQEVGRDFGWFNSDGDEITSAADILADGVVHAKLAPEGDYTLTISSKGETISCKPSGNAFTLGDESAYWLFGGEVYAAGETITLTADATVYALAPTMLSGASVRTEEHSSGLRFETVIDRGLLDALEGDFAIGTLIIPTDLLGSTAFTVEALDAAGKNYLAVEADLVNDDVLPGFLESAEGATFRAAIVNIQAQNYTRRFSAISYIKYNGEYYYSEYSAADHSRSVYEVAVESDKKNPTASYADVVRGFINGVVEIKDGAQVAPYAGYTHPLSVSIADGVLTISGAELTEGALKTVLLDGVAYTRGWRFEGGSFKANLPEN